MPGCILSRNLATKTSFGTQALQKAVRRFLGLSPIVMADHGPTHAERARMRAYPPIDFTTRQRRPVSVACVQWGLVALRYDAQSVCSAMRSTNRSDRSDPVTPANNPKSGNAFSTGSSPRRRNLDLNTNRILARAAITSRIAGLHARPGPLRSARGDRGRWSSRLRVGASIRRNDDSGQNDKFHERFHGDRLSLAPRSTKGSFRHLDRSVPRQSPQTASPLASANPIDLTIRVAAHCHLLFLASFQNPVSRRSYVTAYLCEYCTHRSLRRLPAGTMRAHAASPLAAYTL